MPDKEIRKLVRLNISNMASKESDSFVFDSPRPKIIFRKQENHYAIIAITSCGSDTKSLLPRTKIRVCPAKRAED